MGNRIRLFLLPCYPIFAKIIIYKVSVSRIYRCKPFPIDTDDWFTHNGNDLFSRFEFRVLNVLMMDYKADGDALSLHFDNLVNSFGLQLLTLLVLGTAPQDLADQLTAPQKEFARYGVFTRTTFET